MRLKKPINKAFLPGKFKKAKAYAAIAAGACVALFGPDADSLASPALQFTIAAAPWVFMALGIGLYAAARGATHEDETPDGSASDAEGSKR